MVRITSRRHDHVDLTEAAPTPPPDTRPSFDHAKRPVSRAAGSYGHPIHPIAVTIPIGAWVTSFVFDLVTKIDTNGAADLFKAAKWAIGIGILGAVLAAVFGVLDLSTIPRRTAAYRTAATHLVLNVAVVTMFVIGWFARLGQDRTAASSGELFLSLAGLVLLAASGWLGGTLVYRFGVRVAVEDDQRPGFLRREERRAAEQQEPESAPGR